MADDRPSTGTGTVPGAADEAAAPTPPALRSAFGRFATGVTIVTCLGGDGGRVGLTVNSFCSLSLEPPLLLWSLRHASPSLPAFSAASHFAVSVLSEGQIDLSRRFASHLADRFGAGHWSVGLGGAPVLEEAVASFECQRVSRQDVGDHVLFIGRVQRVRESAQPALLYHAGRYRALGDML